VKTSFYLRVIS